MQTQNVKRGSELPLTTQAEILALYPYRATLDNPNGIKKCQPLWAFIKDVDWLRSTDFAVTDTGKLDKRYNHCFSHINATSKNANEKGIIDLNVLFMRLNSLKAHLSYPTTSTTIEHLPCPICAGRNTLYHTTINDNIACRGCGHFMNLHTMTVNTINLENIIKRYRKIA